MKDKNKLLSFDNCVVITCKLYGQQAADLVQKCEGQKITLKGEITAIDCVNGCVVEVDKIN